MHEKVSNYIAVLLLCFTTGCIKKNTNLTKSEKSKLTSEVMEMFDNYHNAIRTHGLKAEFDYLDDSSDFYWVPPEYKSPLTLDSVKTILVENSKFIKSIEFSFETIEVYPLNHTIANYSGIVKGSMIDTSNAEFLFKIIESGTLIKREDGWKLLSGQSRNLE